MADVVFIKDENSQNNEEKSDDAATSTADDDVWDDTALIRAYDRAVSLAKEEVTRRMGLNKDSPSGNESNTSVNKNRRKKKNSSKSTNKWGWKLGDNCRALYSGDGVMYEATISSLNQDKGTCHVTYLGYDNKEEVPLKILKPSSGEAARKAQVTAAIGEKTQEQNGVDMDCSDDHRTPRVEKMDWQLPYSQAQGLDGRLRMPPLGMVVPPPPPPHLIASSPDNDSEVLSAMLMSWYISGYHTGYYQGLKQGKSSVANSDSFGGNSSKKK